MRDEYRLLAPFYQVISQAVFGRDLLEANQSFHEGNKKVLILGGGDGLAYRDFKQNIHGEFWELSLSMIRLAEKNLEGSKLKFYHGTWPGLGEFDRIDLPFVLDTMSDAEIKNLLVQLKSALSDQGQVIVTDFFAPVSFGQKIIQKSMIWFFRAFTSHQRKDLPAISRFFKNEGFELIEEKSWRRGWIRAQRWQPV
jgi:hypothetical protein